MAKNNKNQIEAEPVVKYDQLGMEVTKCDLQNINIESLIHIIRGQKVMFDSDLAMLYGVETRTLNQAVKRNITRFPDDFMFQVTKEEWNSLRSQIVTLEDLKSQNVISNSVDEKMNERLTSQIAILKNGRGQHRKFMPYTSLVFQIFYAFFSFNFWRLQIFALSLQANWQSIKRMTITTSTHSALALRMIQKITPPPI